MLRPASEYIYLYLHGITKGPERNSGVNMEGHLSIRI